jgi:hypothetical protein
MRRAGPSPRPTRRSPPPSPARARPRRVPVVPPPTAGVRVRGWGPAGAVRARDGPPSRGAASAASAPAAGPTATTPSTADISDSSPGVRASATRSSSASTSRKPAMSRGHRGLSMSRRSCASAPPAGSTKIRPSSVSGRAMAVTESPSRKHWRRPGRGPSSGAGGGSASAMRMTRSVGGTSARSSPTRSPIATRRSRGWAPAMARATSAATCGSLPMTRAAATSASAGATRAPSAAQSSGGTGAWIMARPRTPSTGGASPSRHARPRRACRTAPSRPARWGCRRGCRR